MLDVYNLAVYAELYRNPVAGTPRIINYYEETGQLTVIEEYISGTSLQDKIRHADISPNEMLQYMLDLCAILEQLHQHNPAIIHRDVKPSNVIITSYNRSVLLDFNAAKYHTATKDSDTILLGTQGYAALNNTDLDNPPADRYLFYGDSSEGNGGSIALPESIY